MISKRYPEKRYFQHFETFHREENGGKRGDGNSFLWLAGFWWWRRRNGPPGSTSSALPTAKATAYVAEGGAKKARARARTRFRQASGQLTTAWASRVFLGSSSNCTEGRRVLLIAVASAAAVGWNTWERKHSSPWATNKRSTCLDASTLFGRIGQRQAGTDGHLGRFLKICQKFVKLTWINQQIVYRALCYRGLQFAFHFYMGSS